MVVFSPSEPVLQVCTRDFFLKNDLHNSDFFKINLFICVCLCISVIICVHVCVCTCTCVGMCMCACVHVHICASTERPEEG